MEECGRLRAILVGLGLPDTMSALRVDGGQHERGPSIEALGLQVDALFLTIQIAAVFVFNCLPS